MSKCSLVSLLRLGLSRLAAIGVAIWKAASLLVLNLSYNGTNSSIPFEFHWLTTSKAIMIWVPYTTTNGQWIASKILQGFFGAPIESLCEISVTDIYFTHERGTYLAVYALFLAGSNFLAPVFAGFINDSQGWKWVLVQNHLNIYQLYTS